MLVVQYFIAYIEEYPCLKQGKAPSRMLVFWALGILTGRGWRVSKHVLPKFYFILQVYSGFLKCQVMAPY